MAVATYTKSGSKATTPAKLDKAVFGVEVKNHQLLKDAYLAYLANGRTNNAVTKTRGMVRGSTIKPWRQKGTGNARFGSRYNPIWRGGGIAFGPTGSENYSRKLSTTAKKQALRQALTLAAKEDRVKVIEKLNFTGKVKDTVNLMKKLDNNGRILLVVENVDQNVTRSVKNIQNVEVKSAKYLNTYWVMSSDVIVVEKPALDIVNEWLGVK